MSESRTEIQPRPISERTRKRRTGFRRELDDWLLGLAGVSIAAVCLAFPWHVYFNPQQYGPPKMRFSRDGQVPALPYTDDSPRISVGPELGEDPLIDSILTGTVPGGSPTSVPSLDEQPFPGDVEFDLVFAVPGRALIRDTGGLYPVGIRSVLPDGSRVAAIRKVAGGWELVTSRDQILRLQE